APAELRLERAMKRDSSSRELILKRIQNQMCDEEKRELTDYVILNDGKTPLIPQVESLLKERLCPNTLILSNKY
ncbi:Dephospho-CoA kinase, partial [termite gut metagenome]